MPERSTVFITSSSSDTDSSGPMPASRVTWRRRAGRWLDLHLEERMGTQEARQMAGRTRRTRERPDARDKAVPALFACVCARTVVLPAVKFRAPAARARPRNCPL